ncbi:MAG: methyltransferase [Chloroflexi bacterium]|nr:MAG: methyltransferase [Chloroflexota bacterium]
MSIPKSHYFEARPAVASRPRTVKLHMGDIQLELQADRGVFGSRGIDPGTLVLLKEAPPPPVTGDLLDPGSGYGPIALVLARRAPQAKVWAVDVNEVGKAPLHELLMAWLPRLKPGGAAYLVVQRNLGSDSLAGWMRKEQGWNVTRLKSKKGYRVLEVRPAP